MMIQCQNKRIGPQMFCGLLLGLCFGWSGCGTPTKQEPARPVAARTPLNDLPSAYRELWAAWIEQAAEWPLRREMALEDPGLTRFLVENLIGELITAYKAGAFTQPGADRLGQYDLIKQELAVIGAPAAGPLAELLALGVGQWLPSCIAFAALSSQQYLCKAVFECFVKLRLLLVVRAVVLWSSVFGLLLFSVPCFNSLDIGYQREVV